MVSMFFKFFISIIFFNWVWAEVGSVAPGVRDGVDTVTRTLAIPTHEQWGFDLASFDPTGGMFAPAVVRSVPARERRAEAAAKPVQTKRVQTATGPAAKLINWFKRTRNDSPHEAASRTSGPIEVF